MAFLGQNRFKNSHIAGREGEAGSHRLPPLPHGRAPPSSAAAATARPHSAVIRAAGHRPPPTPSGQIWEGGAGSRAASTLLAGRRRHRPSPLPPGARAATAASGRRPGEVRGGEGPMREESFTKFDSTLASYLDGFSKLELPLLRILSFISLPGFANRRRRQRGCCRLQFLFHRTPNPSPSSVAGDAKLSGKAAGSRL
uniref:Uncharacterized protein OJ1111_A10.16 n=1 Tax=Oryza sativa subsp. japonica TaxID=39947 RepID=Q60EZ6_ORYSJ|nr:hypothetical protein [Oryza sativa Japonica Group]